MTAAVLTVSDRVSAGQMVDQSGPAVVAQLEAAGFSVTTAEVLPDDRERLAEWLRRVSPAHDLIATTGGTGLAPRDVTPEATGDVIDYDVPGLAELMRLRGIASTPLATLSRSRAGVLGRTLILNLPGSVAGARESLQAVTPVLDHAVRLLHGEGDHR